MKKLVGLLTALAVAFSNTSAYAATEVVGTIAFIGSSSSLSASQKASIKTLVSKKRVQTQITCSAFVLKTASSATKTLASKRAKTTCDQAKLYSLRSAGTKVVTVTTVSKTLVGKVNLKITFQETSTQEISLTNLDPIWTEELAWKNIQEYLSTIPNLELKPTLRFTSNVPASRRDEAERQIELVYRFWSPYFKPQTSQIDALFWHDKDLESAQNTYQEMLRGFAAQNQLKDGILDGSDPYCAHAAALSLNTNPQTFVLHQCVGSGSSSLAERHTTPHEYTHFVHFQFGSMPIWITEGSATFYGEALGIYPVDYGRRVLDSHRNSLFQSYDVALGKAISSNTLKNLLKKNDESTVKKLFSSLEAPLAYSQADYTAAYLLGSFATGVLVANFGHEKFVAFMKSFGTNSNYEANFTAAFGMTPSQFYAYLTPYLANNPSVRG